MKKILKNQHDILNIIILCIIVFIFYYILSKLYINNNNKNNNNNNNKNNNNDNNLDIFKVYTPEPLYLQNLDETEKTTNIKDIFNDNTNIKTNNMLYAKDDKYRDVLLDLYNNMYSDTNYYELSDLKEDNTIKRKETIFSGGNKESEMIDSINEINTELNTDLDNNDDFIENNQETIESEEEILNDYNDDFKINANSIVEMDNMDPMLKNFKVNNIIKNNNNNIGIITKINKKDVTIEYKIINNSDVNNLKPQILTLFKEQLNNVIVIAKTIDDYKKIIENNELINDNSLQLTENWILFLNNKKWFPIDFTKKFTLKHKLSDIYEYIFNNISLYTNLSVDNINILNTTFINEYKNTKILINNININKNNLASNMLLNIRKNIKKKLLNNIPIKNFKDLKLVSLVQENNYNYEKYLIDYYNIYIIISNYKLNNIKLNKNICRDLLYSYKKQCKDTTLVHLEDCNKEQLQYARSKRDKINTQIELLEQNEI